MKVLSINPTDAINTIHRKEKHFYKSFKLIAFKDGEFKEHVTLRFYGTQSRTYCVVWVNNDGVYMSGSAFAGGYGYDRSSAAAFRALQHAGIEYDTNWGGTGQTEQAINAIAEHFGFTHYYVSESHA